MSLFQRLGARPPVNQCVVVVFGSSGELVGDLCSPELPSGSTEGGRPSHLRLRIARYVRAIRRRRRKGLTESVGEMTINEYM